MIIDKHVELTSLAGKVHVSPIRITESYAKGLGSSWCVSTHMNSGEEAGTVKTRGAELVKSMFQDLSDKIEINTYVDLVLMHIRHDGSEVDRAQKLGIAKELACLIENVRNVNNGIGIRSD